MSNFKCWEECTMLGCLGHEVEVSRQMYREAVAERDSDNPFMPPDKLTITEV